MSARVAEPHLSQERAVFAATAVAGAMVAQQVAGKAVRDALFLSLFSVETLPAVLMGSALLGGISVLVFSRLLARHGPARMLPAAFTVAMLGLVAEWGVSLVRPGLAALLFYAHAAVFTAPLASGFWSLLNERFDPYAARRAMARVGTGASLGGVAGGVLAWAVSGHVATNSMLPLLATLQGACLPGLLFLRAGAEASAAPREAPLAGSGLSILRESTYLRDLALLVGLGALASAALDYSLNAQAVAVFRSGPALISFFSLFHGGVALLALAVQTFATRKALETLGLAGTAATKSVAAGLGALAGLLAPQLATATLARAAEAVLNSSLYRSGYELLFTPLAEERKRPTKAIVDVGFDRLGTLAGGAIALAVVAVVPQAATRVLFAVAAVAAFASFVLCRRIHSGYVLVLEESLRSGALRLDPGDILDSTTRRTFADTSLALDRESLLRQIHALRGEPELAPAALAALDATAGEGHKEVEDEISKAVRALRSDDLVAIRGALARDLEPALVALTIPLLARTEVFLEALQALRRAAPKTTGQLVDALLDRSQPEIVRRRLPRVLRASATQRSAEGLLEGLGDPAFEVRYECGSALARIGESVTGLALPSGRIFAATLIELAALPGLTDEARKRRLEHVFHLFSLVLETEPVRIAHAALRSENALKGTALEYLENVLPGDVRTALWSALGEAAPAGRSPRRPQDLVNELLRVADRTSLRARSRPPKSEA